MVEQRDIIEKIKKCLRLSQNNPSSEEAASAAMMAQRLMAKHHVEIAEIDDENVGDEAIVKEFVDIGTGMHWKIRLSGVVAENFRCKHYIVGRFRIAFFGQQTDARIAREVFQFLFDTGHRLARSAANRATYQFGTNRGVYNSFVTGFIRGVQSRLATQCLALMIVTPKKVIDDFAELSTGWGTTDGSLRIQQFDTKAYDSGYREGRIAAGQRTLENA